MIWAIDYDGVLDHAGWPRVGKPDMSVIDYLKQCQANGDKLILWTCRDGGALQAAVDMCKGVGLTFDAVNDHLPELKERFGNDCRKIYADVYLDDKAENIRDFTRKHCGKRRGTVRSIRVRG